MGDINAEDLKGGMRGVEEGMHEERDAARAGA